MTLLKIEKEDANFFWQQGQNQLFEKHSCHSSPPFYSYIQSESVKVWIQLLFSFLVIFCSWWWSTSKWRLYIYIQWRRKAVEANQTITVYFRNRWTCDSSTWMHSSQVQMCLLCACVFLYISPHSCPFWNSSYQTTFLLIKHKVGVVQQS